MMFPDKRDILYIAKSEVISAINYEGYYFWQDVHFKSDGKNYVVKLTHPKTRTYSVYENDSEKHFIGKFKL